MSFGKLSLFTPHSSTIMSMEAGPLYPALVREMYPNDRIVISHEALLRAAPMLFPLYSPMKLTFDYFYNENRNVWKGDEAKDWSAFITGSVDGKAIEDPDDLPEHPYITVPEGGFAVGSLGDYLGFRSDASLAGAKVSALRFRHYQHICKNYYLDENFSTMPSIGYTEGEDTTTSLNLQYRCWNKDRFTTATLEPQKGIGVGISLTGSIPVVTDPTIADADNVTAWKTKYTTGGFFRVLSASSSSNAVVQNINHEHLQHSGSGTTTPSANDGINSSSLAFASYYDPNGTLIADASDVDPIPIDEFHFLTQIERLNQRDNMWGTRDFECIRTHFGCFVPDTRLQRPTWLGRSVVDVNFSEVLQTSQSTDSSAQGNIAGHTLAVSKNRPVKFMAREHGFLFVIANIQPIAQYQDGIPRDAMYQTRYDYMWPILSETGEQELYAAEVFANETNVRTKKIFGFEPRYNHLRFGEKSVHGDFRSSLSAYHAGRIFTNEPNLGENFIKADPTRRMFSVELEGTMPYWLRVEFDIKHVRRLPKWPTPSSIGKIF